MKYLRKALAVLLVVALSFLVSGTMVMDASCADSSAGDIPVPSVPEFTLKYVDHSYDVPTTTITHKDPYTGNITTETFPGYHVKNFTIDITIKNQAFPATINGEILAMRYHIQTKGHYEQDWTETHADTKSTSGYTIVSIHANSFTPGGTVDVQIKAWLGFYHDDGMWPPSFGSPRPSDWSSIQSIELTNPVTITPTIPEYPTLLILPLLTVPVIAAAIQKKR